MPKYLTDSDGWMDVRCCDSDRAEAIRELQQQVAALQGSLPPGLQPPPEPDPEPDPPGKPDQPSPPEPPQKRKGRPPGVSYKGR